MCTNCGQITGFICCNPTPTWHAICEHCAIYGDPSLAVTRMFCPQHQPSLGWDYHGHPIPPSPDTCSKCGASPTITGYGNGQELCAHCLALQVAPQMVSAPAKKKLTPAQIKAALKQAKH
jgi:hypothetical protein